MCVLVSCCCYQPLSGVLVSEDFVLVGSGIMDEADFVYDFSTAVLRRVSAHTYTCMCVVVCGVWLYMATHVCNCYVMSCVLVCVYCKSV